MTQSQRDTWINNAAVCAAQAGQLEHGDPWILISNSKNTPCPKHIDIEELDSAFASEYVAIYGDLL